MDENKALRVVENFFIKNDSNPPRTQFSERSFEFYLPAGAVIEGSAALAPGAAITRPRAIAPANEQVWRSISKSP